MLHYSERITETFYIALSQENTKWQSLLFSSLLPSPSIPQVKPTSSPATIPKYQLSVTTAKQSKAKQSKAKQLQKWEAVSPSCKHTDPSPPPTTVDSDSPIPPTNAVSRPSPQNTPKEGLNWTQTAEEWSRILAHTTEHCRRYQLERLAEKKTRETYESVPIIPRTTISFRPAPPRTESHHAAWIEEAKTWSWDFARKIEQREMRERAYARANAQLAELASYKIMWSMLCAGLVISAFLFLILFTDVLRDTKGSQLGVSTTCDAVPSLMEISLLSVVYWTAVALYVIARLAAPIAAEKRRR